MEISKKIFDTYNGETVYAYHLLNDNGMKIVCLNLGGIVTEILTPDRQGNFENIVLGYKTVAEYIKNNTKFGAMIGRTAGRIRNAEMVLDGVTYNLAANSGKNHIHGGFHGFDTKCWDAKTFCNDHEAGVEFSFFSEDGEEGYPGNVQMKVTYILNNRNEWIIRCEGSTDKRTLINMTNHSYFNLSGNAKADILEHRLTLKSDYFLKLDDEFLPTGEKVPVDGTIFDFRKGRIFKEGASSSDEQTVLVGNGYDHPFLLSENKNKEMILVDENSGRVLIVETNQPSVVLYTANQLSEDHGSTKEGVRLRKHMGVCLETQGVPDAIHHPHFPQVTVDPDDTYFAETVYKFLVK